MTYTQVPAGNSNGSSNPNQQPSSGLGGQPPFSAVPLAPLNAQWSAYVADHSSPSGAHLFTGLNAALCIDVLAGQPATGSGLQIYECNLFASAQTWTWVAGQLRIADPSGQLYCLSLPGSSLNPNVPTTAACTSATGASETSQLWRWQAGMMQLADTNQCLGLTANAPQKGLALQTYPCDPDNNTQQWRIGSLGTSEGGVNVPMGVHLSNRLDPSTCLDLRTGDINLGVVETYPCNASAAQKWVFERGTIASLDNTCIGVDGAPEAGASIKLSACQPNEPRQQWAWSGSSLALANTDLCMCVPLGTPPASAPPLTLASCPAGPGTGLNCQWLMGPP